MDIAKIRKKLKKGGERKKRKGADEKQEQQVSDDVAEPAAEATGGETIATPEVPEPPEHGNLPEEEPSVSACYDDEEEQIPVTELLAFRVSGQMYAFRVEDVQEILRGQSVTPVPASAPFLTGITSLRGTIIPVMDMGRRLIVDKEYDYGNKTKIIVLYGPKGSIGVLISGAVKVLNVPVTLVDESPEGLTMEEARFISGVARDSGRLVFIVNVEELFNFSTKVEAR